MISSDLRLTKTYCHWKRTHLCRPFPTDLVDTEDPPLASHRRSRDKPLTGAAASTLKSLNETGVKTELSSAT